MKRLLPLLIFLLICSFTQTSSARMNAYIAGSVASAAESCSYDYDALDTDTSIASLINYRIFVPANTLSCSGTQIKVTFEAHSSNDSYIDGTSVCVRSGTTDDCTDTPTRITWSTANTVQITAAGTATSDWINYVWTKTDDHFIHIYMSDRGTQWIRRKNAVSGAIVYYEGATGDFTMETTWTSGGTTENMPFITKIECK